MPLPTSARGRLAVCFACAIALAIVGGLAFGFGQQITRARQMRAEELRLEQAVAAEQAHQDALVAQLEYVRSPECPEEWARVDARMGRPGEVVVILVDDLAEEPVVDAPPTPTPEPEPQSFWRELWELVFAPSDR